MSLLRHSFGLLLLAMMSGAGMAQTTGATSPNSTSDSDSAKKAWPQGGCMPIGITAAGDVVFPFECKEFLDRYKAEMDKSSDAGGGAPNPPNPSNPPSGGTEAHGPQAAPAPAQVAAPASKTAAPAAQAAAPAPKDAPRNPDDATAAIQSAPAAPAPKSAVKQSKHERKVADSDDDDDRATPQRHAAATKHKTEKGTAACMHFRTYDPDSGTYKGYDGQRRSCP